MLNIEWLALHILNAFCHASHGEILLRLTLVTPHIINVLH